MVKFVIIELLLCLASAGNAQVSQTCCRINHSFHFGYSLFDQNLGKDTDYEPVLFIYSTSVPLTRRDVQNTFFIYFEPQINPVFFKNRINIEFGMNAGLNYSRELNESLIAYLLLGTGPHFINARTQRQAAGFIFSDNLAIGIRKILPSNRFNVELNIQYRLRHISNAGLKSPNGGINNGFLMIGLTKNIQRSKGYSLKI
jgi:hypothetical protein